MNYSSPIEVISTNMDLQYEDGVLRAIRNVGVHVNKAELEKALLYDRNQYVKGFEDAITRMFEIMDDQATEREAIRHHPYEWVACIDFLKGRIKLMEDKL